MIDVELPEILAAYDRMERHPEDQRAVRDVLGAPPEAVARCLTEGFLAKRGTWTVPVLTPLGKARLRAWRTCMDCHEECIEGTHDCPARRSANPYRDTRARERASITQDDPRCIDVREAGLDAHVANCGCRA